MSAPRRPFGAQQPGRLPSTMMKVLAAETSDPGRLSRGKQYARSGAVTDIAVDPGVVTCTVQGSRPTPYVATIHVRPGDGMPLRRDLRLGCTCPDLEPMVGGGTGGGTACKHVVAAMFAFAQELLVEPDLLDVWRDRASGTGGGTDGEVHGGAVPESHGAVTPPPDPLAAVLRAPAPLPEVPEVPLVEPPEPGRPELAAALREALATLRAHAR